MLKFIAIQEFIETILARTSTKNQNFVSKEQLKT